MNLVAWLDTGAGHAVAALHRPWLNAVMIAATDLGRGAVTATVAAVVIAALLVFRRWRPALCIAVAVAAGFLFADGLKLLVGRPRPDVPWRLVDLPSTYSFPSGHATNSMTAYASLGLIAGRRLRRRWQRVLALRWDCPCRCWSASPASTSASITAPTCSRDGPAA